MTEASREARMSFERRYRDESRIAIHQSRSLFDQICRLCSHSSHTFQIPTSSMSKYNSYAHLTALLVLPSLAMAASLRGRVAFNSKVLKIAVDDWLRNSTVACLKYGGNISEWDTSRVYNMSNLFANARHFDEDLSQWNVGNVRDFTGTFSNASSFTADLSLWDTSNALYMAHMFDGASSFNSDLSRWNTTNVLDFSYMFANAQSFNGSVNNFDVTNSYNLSFMFANASSFNQNISDWTREDLDKTGFRAKWVQNMQSMFQGATSFNQDLTGWQTFAVTNMNSMFKNATSFSGAGLSNWNVKTSRTFVKCSRGEQSSHRTFVGMSTTMLAPMTCWTELDFNVHQLYGGKRKSYT